MTISKWRYNLSSLPLSHYKEAVGSCLKTRIEDIISGAINQSQMNVTASFWWGFFVVVVFFLEFCQGKLSCPKDYI